METPEQCLKPIQIKQRRHQNGVVLVSLLLTLNCLLTFFIEAIYLNNFCAQYLYQASAKHLRWDFCENH